MPTPAIVEIVADDVAASFRFATAEVHKVERSGPDGGGGGGGGRRAPAPAPANAAAEPAPQAPIPDDELRLILMIAPMDEVPAMHRLTEFGDRRITEGGEPRILE